MTKLQTAWLVFYYFLFVRIQEVIRQNLVVFFVNFALFLEVCNTGALLCRKWWCIFALQHFMKLTVSLISFSLERHLQFHILFSFFLFNCNSRPIMSHLPWHALLLYVLTAYIVFNLSWLSLWHSTTEKGYNSHPKLNKYHHLPILMPEASKFTLIDDSDDSNSVKKQGDDFS